MDAAWIGVALTACGALLGGGVTFGIAMGRISALTEKVADLGGRLDKLADDHEERLRLLEKQRLPLFVHAGGGQHGQA